MKSLDVAVAVVRSGSMSGVAKRFGLTQSAVSQAVGRIERIVGSPLVGRQTRPLSATPAGLALAREFEAMSQSIATVLDAARGAAQLPERLDLRFGMVDSFAGTVGAELVRELMQGELALRLSAWSGLASEHAQSLLEHGIDFAITSDAMETVSAVVDYLVFTEPFILLVPSSSQADLRGSSLADILKRHALIRHSARSHMGQQVERHIRRLRLDAPNVMEFDTSDAIVAMVGTGLGVAITTPLCLLQGIAQADHVACLPLPTTALTRSLYLVTRRGELETVAPRIAASARDLLIGQALARVAPMLPA